MDGGWCWLGLRKNYDKNNKGLKHVFKYYQFQWKFLLLEPALLKCNLRRFCFEPLLLLLFKKKNFITKSM